MHICMLSFWFFFVLRGKSILRWNCNCSTYLLTYSKKRISFVFRLCLHFFVFGFHFSCSISFRAMHQYKLLYFFSLHRNCISVLTLSLPPPRILSLSLLRLLFLSNSFLLFFYFFCTESLSSHLVLLFLFCAHILHFQSVFLSTVALSVLCRLLPKKDENYECI